MSGMVDTVERLVHEHLGDLEQFAHDCHNASLQLVRSGALRGIAPVDRYGRHCPRVVRGSCHGVPGQHSWVIMSGDCLDMRAMIIDITLWSYDDTQPQVWTGYMERNRLHTPKASHRLMDYGIPVSRPRIDEPIRFDTSSLSIATQMVFSEVGLLDYRGWSNFWSNVGMAGWDSGAALTEFLRQHPKLQAVVPVDVIGNYTELNPYELYW